MKIPQTDPGAGYLARKAEIDAAVARVLGSGWYILGEEVAAFEAEFAGYMGVTHAVGVASGTDAVMLALKACGVGAGDEVITVSHTAVATVVGIELTGATPVFVDVAPDTYLMDVGQLEGALTERTKAVMPVHLYGLPCDMGGVLAFAGKYGLRVVEDCAQAHGATILDGQECPSYLVRGKVGAFGDVGAFSFYPTKNLGAFGDGGCVVTGDGEIAERVRWLRQYGWKERYVSDVSGVNSRLDELQAAILRVRLPHLTDDNAARRRIATIYDEALAELRPVVPEGRGHVYHQYVIRVPGRDAVRASLAEAGIGTAIHYPVPVHQQPAYRHLAPSGGLPVTEALCADILSLPMYPQLTDTDAHTVSDSVLKALSNP